MASVAGVSRATVYCHEQTEYVDGKLTVGGRWWECLLHHPLCFLNKFRSVNHHEHDIVCKSKDNNDKDITILISSHVHVIYKQLQTISPLLFLRITQKIKRDRDCYTILSQQFVLSIIPY